MSTHSLTKRQSPEELELESKRSVMSILSETIADAELQFEELKASLASFQRRYFREVYDGTCVKLISIMPNPKYRTIEIVAISIWDRRLLLIRYNHE